MTDYLQALEAWLTEGDNGWGPVPAGLDYPGDASDPFDSQGNLWSPLDWAIETLPVDVTESALETHCPAIHFFLTDS